MATNSFLSSYTAAPKPTQPTFGSTAPNYLGALGGLLGSIAKPVAQSTPQNSNSFLSSYMGTQAKAPEQNIKAPQTTIAASQQKTQPTQATGTTSKATQTTQTAVNSNANPNYNLQAPGLMAGNGQPSQVAQPPSVQSGPYQVNSGLYGQLIASMANQSQQPGKAYTDAMGQYNTIADQLKQSQTNEANAEAQNRLNPIPIGDQTGREAVMRNQYLAQQNALASRLVAASNILGAANTQQGLLQTLLQQAAAGASPITLSGGAYLQNPLGGGAADSQSGFQQGIKNLTNLGIAQQNISQGQQYQAAAQEVSNNLQLISPVTNILSPYLAANNLDTNGVPFVNQQINKINAQANPVAYNTLTTAMGEIQNYAANMLGSLPGLTPTAQSDIVNSWATNMANMTPAQLSAFSHNLEVLGQIRLAQLQSASQAGYGANSTVGTPAQGMDANTSQQLQSAGQNALNNLPDWAKYGAGLLLSTVSGAANVASGEASSAIGSAAGTGLAAKVLGLGGE